MDFTEIMDVYLNPKSFIVADIYSIRSARDAIREAKNKMKTIEKQYPETYKKRFDWRAEKDNAAEAKEIMRYHKKEMNKWFRIAKKRNIKLTKKQIADVKRLRKVM